MFTYEYIVISLPVSDRMASNFRHKGQGTGAIKACWNSRDGARGLALTGLRIKTLVPLRKVGSWNAKSVLTRYKNPR